jgi:hypothetical protein
MHEIDACSEDPLGKQHIERMWGNSSTGQEEEL